MLVENQNDREQQAIASHQYVSHLTKLGVTQVALLETPQHRAICYDFELHVQSMWVGVVEVKSRKVDSQQIEEWGSIVVEVERLKSLGNLFYKTSEVTGKKRWDKEVVFVFRCTRDDWCYAVNIKTIHKNWSLLDDAPAEMMKADHGVGEKECSGKLIPIGLMEKFK